MRNTIEIRVCVIVGVVLINFITFNYIITRLILATHFILTLAILNILKVDFTEQSILITNIIFFVSIITWKNFRDFQINSALDEKKKLFKRNSLEKDHILDFLPDGVIIFNQDNQ